VAIFTGWYDKAAIAKRLDRSEYAAIGNIYNAAEGVDPGVRNLLANPQVDTVLCLSSTQPDANCNHPSLLLAEFLRHPQDPVMLQSETGLSYWGHPDLKGPQVKPDIPIEAIRELKNRVAVVTFESCDRYGSAQDLVAFCKFADQSYTSDPLPDPILLPPPETKVTILPGPAHGVSIEGQTIVETWLKIIQAIHTTGKVIDTGNGQRWQELISLVAVVHNEPEGFYFPDGEWFPCTKDFLFGTDESEGYVSQILDDAPAQEGTKYTYGQRLRSWFGKDQVEDVVQKLLGEREAASAVMSLWDPGSGENARPNREPHTSDHTYGKSPCLNHIWVRIEADGSLVLSATFRSNDMYSAWPSNAMGLRCLQRHILDRLLSEGMENISMGPLITVSHSAHIYETCWPQAASLIDRYRRQMMRPVFADRVGSYTVHRDPDRSGVVVVRRLSTGLNATQCSFYEGSDPRKLFREIAIDAPSIDPYHALYLGSEITRAFTDPNYSQDDRWP